MQEGFVGGSGGALAIWENGLPHDPEKNDVHFVNHGGRKTNLQLPSVNIADRNDQMQNYALNVVNVSASSVPVSLAKNVKIPTNSRVKIVILIRD